MSRKAVVSALSYTMEAGACFITILQKMQLGSEFILSLPLRHQSTKEKMHVIVMLSTFAALSVNHAVSGANLSAKYLVVRS